MVNMTLSIPADVRKEMKHFGEIKWSEVARKAIISKLEMLRMADKLAKKSKLTKKDVNEFSSKIKSSTTKRFLS